MKKFSLIVLALGLMIKAFGWGLTGHRIVGLIAEDCLSNKAKKNIAKILGAETLAEVSTYMDFIRSDATHKHMSKWHYVTIPDGNTYADVGTPEAGDALVTIQRLIKELTSKRFTDEDEAFALKCLVHLIGDVHQPLHVGNGNDKGGNDIRLKYFRKSSNLHRVWDSQIIDSQNYSYTEYVSWINHPTKKQLTEWASLEVFDWGDESMEARNQCYDTMPENKKLSYRYIYDNIELVNQRLLQAGIRLGNVLNKIYG